MYTYMYIYKSNEKRSYELKRNQGEIYESFGGGTEKKRGQNYCIISIIK